MKQSLLFTLYVTSQLICFLQLPKSVFTLFMSCDLLLCLYFLTMETLIFLSITSYFSSNVISSFLPHYFAPVFPLSGILFPDYLSPTFTYNLIPTFFASNEYHASTILDLRKETYLSASFCISYLLLLTKNPNVLSIFSNYLIN